MDALVDAWMKMSGLMTTVLITVLITVFVSREILREPSRRLRKWGMQGTTSRRIAWVFTDLLATAVVAAVVAMFLVRIGAVQEPGAHGMFLVSVWALWLSHRARREAYSSPLFSKQIDAVHELMEELELAIGGARALSCDWTDEESKAKAFLEHVRSPATSLVNLLNKRAWILPTEVGTLVLDVCRQLVDDNFDAKEAYLARLTASELKLFRACREYVGCDPLSEHTTRMIHD